MVLLPSAVRVPHSDSVAPRLARGITASGRRLVWLTAGPGLPLAGSGAQHDAVARCTGHAPDEEHSAVSLFFLVLTVGTQRALGCLRSGLCGVTTWPLRSALGFMSPPPARQACGAAGGTVMRGRPARALAARTSASASRRCAVLGATQYRVASSATVGSPPKLLAVPAYALSDRLPGPALAVDHPLGPQWTPGAAGKFPRRRGGRRHEARVFSVFIVRASHAAAARATP
jgi:hypothetical protein